MNSQRESHRRLRRGTASQQPALRVEVAAHMLRERQKRSPDRMFARRHQIGLVQPIDAFHVTAAGHIRAPQSQSQTHRLRIGRNSLLRHLESVVEALVEKSPIEHRGLGAAPLRREIIRASRQLQSVLKSDARSAPWSRFEIVHEENGRKGHQQPDVFRLFQDGRLKALAGSVVQLRLALAQVVLRGDSACVAPEFALRGES